MAAANTTPAVVGCKTQSPVWDYLEYIAGEDKSKCIVVSEANNPLLALYITFLPTEVLQWLYIGKLTSNVQHPPG
jgi:hypothetical protein